MDDATYAHLDGASLSLIWSLPFVGLLVSIALVPLLAPHFWEHHFGKVAAFWAVALLVPCAIVFGISTAAAEFLHTFLLDYLPFILLLFALFVVAGGIRLSGNLVGTPETNTAILAFGTLLANLLGTTGASMLLIRPVISANQARRHNAHVFVFFIFLVAEYWRVAYAISAALSRFPQGRRFLLDVGSHVTATADYERPPACALLCDRSSRLEPRNPGGQENEMGSATASHRRAAQRDLSRRRGRRGAREQSLEPWHQYPAWARYRVAAQRPYCATACFLILSYLSWKTTAVVDPGRERLRLVADPGSRNAVRSNLHYHGADARRVTRRRQRRTRATARARHVDQTAPRSRPPISG